MTAPLRAAVIGTGTISREHLAFLSAANDVVLVAVCDLSRVSARYARDEFGATDAYVDHTSMLDGARPDVVHILTPPATHFGLVSECLTAGAHVICEKPIALSLVDLESLKQIAARTDRYFVEDQNYRFNEPIVHLRNLIDLGSIGDVREVEVRLALQIREGGRLADVNLPSPIHALPGGAVHDFVTHLAYLALHLSPVAEFDRVRAAWSNHGGGDLFKYDDLDAVLISGPVHVRLRFSCHTKPDCFTAVVRGTEGTLEANIFQPHVRVDIPRLGGSQLSPLANQLIGGTAQALASVRNFRRKLMQETPYAGLHGLLTATYRALATGQIPPIEFEDMAAPVRLIEQLLEASNQL
jgi:predicted dehydrogenase